MEHLSLLAGGQGHDRAEESSRERAAWEKAAAAVLRKAGRMKAEDPDALVWEKLTRTTLDGIAVPPLGTAESVAGLPEPGVPGQAPFIRGAAVSRPDEGWDIRAHLAEPDARQAAAFAVNDLENGVTSLWLSVGPGAVAVTDLATVLAKVYVDLAPVVLDAPADPVGAAEAFAALVEDRGVTPAPGTSLGGDPIGALASGGAGRTDLDAVVRLAELAQRLGAFALTVDATHVHDAGATDAQELGYALAAGVAYLRVLTEQAGLSVVDAARLLEFRHAVTDEQFPSIAKLRAARRLWHRVLELSGAAEAPGQVQHAVTSRPMMSKYDPYTNILRGTVAAFAAGVGGATSVTVLPFDTMLGMPTEFSRRNARNTSSLLIHEAHVARVTDAAGGAYAVERLTDDLARAGWAQFQRIEAEGGVVASLSLDEGGFFDRIRDEGMKPRYAAIARRKRPLTGISEFPNLEEELPERRPWPEGSVAYSVNRYGIHFEAMRDDPAGTPVFLATLGTIAQHTARASFAGNLLAAGGVDTVSAGPTAGPEELVAAYQRESGSPVVCLAGTDASYAEWGAEAVAALRTAGARYVILAGKPGERTVSEELVDDSCAMGVDALAFLTRVREELAR